MIELADYSISQCLHEGSETAVYSGLRLRDNLPVVVKLPRAEHPLPTVMNRLRHEYALLREYAQPGIVKGLELVRSPSSLALILEYVEGEPLTALVRSRKLDLALVLRIGLELAEILTRLHDRHVVHKDLKPHEIFTSLTRRDDRQFGAPRTCCGWLGAGRPRGGARRGRQPPAPRLRARRFSWEVRPGRPPPRARRYRLR